MCHAALAESYWDETGKKATAIRLGRHIRMLLCVQALYFTWCDRLAGSFRDTHCLIPEDAQKKTA